MKPGDGVGGLTLGSVAGGSIVFGSDFELGVLGDKAGWTSNGWTCFLAFDRMCRLT